MEQDRKTEAKMPKPAITAMARTLPVSSFRICNQSARTTLPFRLLLSP